MSLAKGPQTHSSVLEAYQHDKVRWRFGVLESECGRGCVRLLIHYWREAYKEPGENVRIARESQRTAARNETADARC